MSSKNKIVQNIDLECPNCHYPFLGHEKFCPECGQKNKGEKIEFTAFVNEVFKGFTSWDGKFWKTIIPLTIYPGKVSKNYISGKRNAYLNPFRFYIIVSILFFISVSLKDSVEKINFLRKGKENSVENISEKKEKEDETLRVNPAIMESDEVDDKMVKFIKFKEKYPDLPVNNALDSLSVPKTFSNRFWYDKSELINNITKGNKKSLENIISMAKSYLSLALFVMLPIFSLFLMLLYIKQSYTYIEHLIFVFYTQSIFFILFTIYNLIDIFITNTFLFKTFIVLFLVYLFIAMKRFYKQSNIKTLLKFSLANIVYLILTAIGGLFLLVIAFAIY